MGLLEVLDERVCRLGEGPYYDDRDGRTYWVDSLGAKVLWRGADGQAGEFPAGAHVGAAVPCRSGGAVLCLPAGPVLRAADGMRTPLGTFAEADAAASAPPGAQLLRANDAKADPAGRLWLGTMPYDERPGQAALYRLDPDSSRPVRVRGGVGISNGLGWSPDGTYMYYVDSLTRRVDRYEYDLARGEIGPRRVFAEIAGGYPDGLCVDADGGVWVAIWGGAEVRRYAPDGSNDRTVTLPTPQVTSCAFAGPLLDRLVITTAARRRPDDPYAGITYVHEPDDVCGLPVARFGR